MHPWVLTLDSQASDRRVVLLSSALTSLSILIPIKEAMAKGLHKTINSEAISSRSGKLEVHVPLL